MIILQTEHNFSTSNKTKNELENRNKKEKKKLIE